MKTLEDFLEEEDGEGYSKEYYISKKFLSPEGHYEDSSIVTKAEYVVNPKWKNYDSEIIIRDCYKIISIGMSAKNEEDFLKRVEKLSVLINELVDYKMAYIEGWREFQNAVRADDLRQSKDNKEQDED